VAAVLFLLLGIQQVTCFWTTKENNIFPVGFFTTSYNKETMLLLSCCAAAASIAYTPLYITPFYFQFTRGDTALQAGVRLLALICTMVFFCILNAIAMSVTGYYMPWFLARGALGLIGGALQLSFVNATTSTSEIYGFGLVMGIGSGSLVLLNGTHDGNLRESSGLIQCKSQGAGARVMYTVSPFRGRVAFQGFVADRIPTRSSELSIAQVIA
jgi:hypothetical protein